MEMQMNQRNNAIAVAKKLYADGGIGTFWKGNLMNLIRVAPHKVRFNLIMWLNTFLYSKMRSQTFL